MRFATLVVVLTVSPPPPPAQKQVPQRAPQAKSQSKLMGKSKSKSKEGQKFGPDRTLSDLTYLLSQKSELPLSTPPELQNYINHLETTLSNLTVQHQRATSSLAKLKTEHEALKKVNTLIHDVSAAIFGSFLTPQNFISHLNCSTRCSSLRYARRSRHTTLKRRKTS